MEGKLNIVLNKTVDNKKVFGALVNIESEDGKISYSNSAGDIEKDDQFAIASITKMFTTAIIYNLVESGNISLEDRIDKYFDENFLKGLHVYKGLDYSSTIIIRQLLSHTTGLPDNSTEKDANGKSYFDEVYEKDIPITFEETMKRTKGLEPHFINGSLRKAFYADINFDMLGKIAEKVSHKTLDELYTEYIFQPLKLEATYLCKPDSSFAPFYLGKRKLYRPLTASAAGASGGIISNTSDLMIFLKAFYGGRLFHKSYLINDKYNKIQWFPLEYGMGMMRCKMSRLMSPFFPAPEIIGHSGSTGSFAFYCPSKKVYIVGTINQLNKNPFQTIYLMLNCLE